jgi:hypothetical protein
VTVPPYADLPLVELVSRRTDAERSHQTRTGP